MLNKKIASEVAIVSILLLAVVVGGIFWMQGRNLVPDNSQSIANNQEEEKPIQEDGVICTQDAKLCTDGSYVSRTGPNCEFASCPIEKQQSLNNTSSHFSFKKEIPDGNIPKSVISVLKDGNKIASFEYSFFIGKVELLKETKGDVYFGTQPGELGGYIIYGGYDKLYKLNLANNKIAEVASGDGYLTDIDVSIDNKKVVFRNFDNIVVKDLDLGDISLYAMPSKKDNAQFGNFKFSPDMKKIAIGVAYGPENTYGEVYILDLKTRVYTLYATLPGNTIIINGWKNDNEIDWKGQGL